MIVLSESVNKLIETPLPDDSEMGVNKKTFINTLTHIQTINDIIPKTIDSDALVNFEHKGLGSSRVAYSINKGSQSGTIFKFALNDKGLAQNKAESIILSDSTVKANPYIIKMLDYDKESEIYKQSGNPLWLQLEPLTPYLSDTTIDVMLKSTPKDKWNVLNSAKLNDWSSYFGCSMTILYRLLNGTYGTKYFSFLCLLEKVSRDHLKDDYIQQTLLYLNKFYSKSSIEDIIHLDVDYAKYDESLKRYTNYFINGVYESGKPDKQKGIKKYKSHFEEFGIPDIQYTIAKLGETWNILKARVDHLIDMSKIAHKYNLYVPDLASIHNWGKSSKGYPVLFDIGLDVETFDKYYRKLDVKILPK